MVLTVFLSVFLQIDRFVCWMIKTDSQNFDCPQGEATCTKIS